MLSSISIKKVVKFVGIGMLTVALGACSQMTKHSNTLIFAVNTTSGLKVGTDEKQIPGIQIGHSRQELAFVPVVANTGTSSTDQGDLKPCPDSYVEKCKLIGTHDGVNEDSYSTIASFGSKKGASVDSTGAIRGEVAIAQYFATGVAAQYLAVTGGANIVSAGGDTKAKADATVKAAEAITKAEVAKAGAIAQYASGKQVALVMLGNDETVVLDISSNDYTNLEPKMGVGCDATSLDRVFTRKGVTTIAIGTLTIGEYLDQILDHNPYCFDPLIPSQS